VPRRLPRARRRAPPAPRAARIVAFHVIESRNRSRKERARGANKEQGMCTRTYLHVQFFNSTVIELMSIRAYFVGARACEPLSPSVSKGSREAHIHPYILR
jgi:hypothetical protein